MIIRRHTEDGDIKQEEGGRGGTGLQSSCEASNVLDKEVISGKYYTEGEIGIGVGAGVTNVREDGVSDELKMGYLMNSRKH